MPRITATLPRLSGLLAELGAALFERQQYTSAATSVNILPRAYAQLDREGVWQAAGSVLDIGAGKYATAKDFLAQRRVGCFCYDPHNRDDDENAEALASGRHDVVMLANVLNVIREPDERDKLLRLAKRHVAPDGTLIVQVYPGDGSGKGRRTGADQYQLNQPLAFYEPEVRRHFPEVEVRAGLLRAGLGRTN